MAGSGSRLPEASIRCTWACESDVNNDQKTPPCSTQGGVLGMTSLLFTYLPLFGQAGMTGATGTGVGAGAQLKTEQAGTTGAGPGASGAGGAQALMLGAGVVVGAIVVVVGPAVVVLGPGVVVVGRPVVPGGPCVVPVTGTATDTVATLAASANERRVGTA